MRDVRNDTNPPSPPTPKPGGSNVKLPVLSGPIPFHTILHGQWVGGNTEGLTVINDTDTWLSLVRQSPCSWAPYCTPPPQINFTYRMVLIVAAGEEGSAGYDITVTNVTALPDHLLVQATLTIPGANCVAAAVLTYPGHIVDIPKTNLPADLEVTTTPHSCSPI